MSWEITLFYWVGWFVCFSVLAVLGLFLSYFAFEKYTSSILPRNMFWKALDLFQDWQKENNNWKELLKENKPKRRFTLIQYFKMFIRS